jgi:hypothetical protein
VGTLRFAHPAHLLSTGRRTWPFSRCFHDADRKTFVIEITDIGLIKQARAFVRGDVESKSVQGTIVKQPKAYNSLWSWYLEPGSTSFFTDSTEVCDSSVVYLEKHLGEVGGDFLPHNHGCPWRSRDRRGGGGRGRLAHAISAIIGSNLLIPIPARACL